MKYWFVGGVTLVSMLSFSVTKAQHALTNQYVWDTLSNEPEYYTQRLEQFKKEPLVKGKVVFLGNSITEMGDWRKLCRDPTVINRGISGDVTFMVLKRIDEVIAHKPSKLFLLIGINDIARDIPDSLIANNINKMVKQVQAGSQATKIFVTSILPVDPQFPHFLQHYNKMDRIAAVNKLLREVATLRKVTFINLYPLFLDHTKRLDSKLTVDGLHLNDKGYDVWVSYLKKMKYL